MVPRLLIVLIVHQAAHPSAGFRFDDTGLHLGAAVPRILAAIAECAALRHVIDAGHGGWDTGNYAEGYSGLEKNYNLLIATELSTLLKEKNVGVYMTRTTDVRLDNAERAGLADEVFADYMISIHCDASDNGMSVVYSGEEAKGLAMECLKASEQVFKFESNEAVLNEETNSLLGISGVPAVMVEFDFLIKEEQQKLAARVLADAILKACGIEENK